MHNKVAQVKRGELKDIVQVQIIDEETLLQDLAEYGESIKGRLYDWFKANPKTKPIPFQRPSETTILHTLNGI